MAENSAKLPKDRLTPEELERAEVSARELLTPHRDVRPDVRWVAAAYLDLRIRERETFQSEDAPLLTNDQIEVQSRAFANACSDEQLADARMGWEEGARFVLDLIERRTSQANRDICGAYKEYSFGKNGQGCGKPPNHDGDHGDE